MQELNCRRKQLIREQTYRKFKTKHSLWWAYCLYSILVMVLRTLQPRQYLEYWRVGVFDFWKWRTNLYRLVASVHSWVRVFTIKRVIWITAWYFLLDFNKHDMWTKLLKDFVFGRATWQQWDASVQSCRLAVEDVVSLIFTSLMVLTLQYHLWTVTNVSVSCKALSK